MKRLLLIVFTIIVSGVMAVPGFAAITPGQSSVTPFVGWYAFDDDMLLKDKPVGGLRLGYDLTARWGWEIAFDYVATKPKQASGDVDVFGARLDALYHFRPHEKLVPFLAAGVGGTMAEDTNKTVNSTQNAALLNYGGGVKYFLSKNMALRGDVRHLLIFDGNRQDRQDWEYTIGLTFLFGGKKPAPAPVMVADSDGDGVLDPADKCPNTMMAVAVSSDGCPLDSDGDGVLDSVDKCPGTSKGMQVDKNGCLVVKDGDGDGVPDSLDKCPTTPKNAPVDTVGCPRDSDMDGVADYLDKCLDTPKGVSVDKAGCPLPKKVSIALEVQFASGKTAIQAQYHDQIKKVADFMTEYPGTTAVIEGHTDSVGKETSNARLSTRRSESVRTYLIDNFGIAPERLVAKGFGSSRPVADNATAEGRQKNRRITAVIETME